MPTVIDNPPYDPGFFSCMATVLGALDAYEQGALGDGLRVDLSSGRFLDPSRGPNWWEYHFEPLRIGRMDGPDVPLENHGDVAFAGIALERQDANALLVRHVRLRADVQAAVETFRQRHLAGRPAVGVHYRGTDKVFEANAVPYEQALDQVRRELDRQGSNAVAFVASDEQEFITDCASAFGERCVWTDARRSRRGGPPLHASPPDPFAAGREALVDCLLLAACDLLIRTSSNLGQFAGYFSPAMPILKLNRSYFETE